MKSSFLAVAFLVAASGVAQTGTPVPQPPVALTLPMVYDANGVAMGQIIDVNDTNGTGSMLFQLSNPATVVTVHMRRTPKGVFWGDNTTAMFYDAPNCEGNAFVIATGSFGDYIAVIDKNEDLLIGDVDGPTNPDLKVHSIYSGGQCNDAEVEDSGLSPVVKVDSMKKYFTTPLNVHGLHKARAVTRTR